MLNATPNISLTSGRVLHNRVIRSTRYTPSPIARFANVPDRVFSSTFTCKVPAFHMDGIADLEWRVNGGSWTTVSTMTEDVDVTFSGVGGLMMFQFTLTASDYADGAVDVDARIKSTGDRFTRTISLRLYANDGGTIVPTEKWVATVAGGGDDTTGDGTEGTPYATLGKALNDVSGDCYANVYLKGGNGIHNLTARSSAVNRVSTSKWTNVEADPGYVGTVEINPNIARWAVPNWKLTNLKAKMDSSSDTFQPQIAESNHLWIVDCEITTAGTLAKTDAYIIWEGGNVWGAKYATRSNVNNLPVNTWRGFDIVYDCTNNDTRSDIHLDCALVVSSHCTGGVYTGAGDHVDLIQIGTSGPDNAIYYGVRGVDTDAQNIGLFAGANNVAIVNVLGEENGAALTLKSQLGGALGESIYNHVLLYNVSLPDQPFFQNEAKWYANCRIRNCFFNSIDENAWDGGMVAENCYANIAPAGLPSGFTLVSALDLSDSANDQWSPLSSSDLYQAGTTNAMPDMLAAQVGGDIGSPNVGAWSSVTSYAEGSGTPQAASATAAGTGTVSGTGISASGAPQAATATGAGSSTVLVQGSGTPQAATATTSAAGTVLVQGSGSAQAQTATASGAGVVGFSVISGSGNTRAITATTSGAGTVLVSGSGSPQAATATASGTNAPLLPYSHTTAITAAGFQFTEITANGVTINFSDHILGSVGTIDDIYAARNDNLWTVLQMFDDGSTVAGNDVDLQVKLTAGLVSGGAKLFDFDLDGAGDIFTGSMRITPSIGMAAAVSSLWTFHYCTIEFKIQMPGNGDVDKCLVMLPQTTQSVYKFTDTDHVPNGSEKRYMHPGGSSSGGEIASAPAAVAGLVSYDEPSGLITAQAGANSQCLYLWDSETLEGVLIRTNDNVGQNKIFAVERSGDDLIVRVKFIPQDNSLGINNQSDETPFDYGIEIRPMSGDWNHALKYDKDRMEAESFKAFDKLPINNPLSTYSDRAKEMVCFSSMWSNGVGFEFEAFNEQQRRIKTYFGGPAWSVGGIWYGTEPFGLNVAAPTHTPFLSNTSAKILEAIAEQHTVLAYTLPEHPDKITFDTLNLAIANNLVRTRTGYIDASQPAYDASEQPINVEHVSLAGRIKYIQFTWADATNNREYVAYIVDQWDDHDVGFYLDGYGSASASSNDDPNALPVNRGAGTKTYHPGYMQVSDYFKEESDAADTVVMHEWPCDLGIKHADIVSWESVGVNGISSTQVFGPAAQFGDRVKHSTFLGFGKGPNDDADMDNLTIPGVVDKKEYLNAIFLYWFVGGHMLPVQAYFDQRDEYFIALPGEDDYTDWFQDAIPHYQFLKRLWWTERAFVSRMHTSERLFEMPSSSIIRSKIEDYAGFTNTQHAYLYAQGWYDPITDVLAFSCANWTLSDADGGEIAATAIWADVLTTTLFPDLGTSARDINLIDCLDRSATAMTAYDGSGTYTIPSISMPPGRVVWLVFGDLESVRPPLDIASLTGTYAGTLTLAGTYTQTISLVGTGKGMASTRQNFKLHQGTDKVLEITVSESGAAKDLTAASAVAFKIAAGPGSTADVTKGLGTGVVVTDAANGVIQVTLDAADTTSLAGSYYHETLITIGGTSDVVTVGTVIIEEAINA